MDKVNSLAMAFRMGAIPGPNGDQLSIPAHHGGAATLDQQALLNISDALARILAKQGDLEQKMVGASQLTPSPSADSILPTGLEFGTLGEKVRAGAWVDGEEASRWSMGLADGGSLIVDGEGACA